MTVQRVPTSTTNSTGRVIVDLFTSSYRFSAGVLVYKRRLVDVLSDRLTDYLDLTDIYVSRINNPGEIIATYAKGSLIKETINFILLPNEAEGVSKERFYVPNRVSLPIFLTVPSFEIQGKFQWMGDVDVKKLLTADAQKFLPVLDATSSNLHTQKAKFQGPLILVNKAKIELLCVGEAVG